MFARLFLLLAIASVAPIGSAAWFQDPPDVEQPKPKPLEPPTLAGEELLLGSDGEQLVPGRLPANTEPAAKEAWERALAASVKSGGARAPIRAFELSIDVVFKLRVETTNQGKALYQYCAPGYVRVRMEKTRLEHVRGPAGDFLVDPSREGAVQIDASRDNVDDRRQLDDTLAIARNFLALTDPQHLRIASLAKLAAPPAGLAKSFAKRAQELVWLDVTSPDFRLARGTPTAKLHRVKLGLDPKTWLPVLALVHDGTVKAPLAPSTTFLVLSDWFDASGYQVPKKIEVYEIDEASLAAGRAEPMKLRFRLDPTSDVYLIGAMINPPLKPESFVPVMKKD